MCRPTQARAVLQHADLRLDEFRMKARAEKKTQDDVAIDILFRHMFTFLSDNGIEAFLDAVIFANEAMEAPNV